MNKIVAVRHGANNVIEAYKTDDGQVLSRVEAVDAANAGKLAEVSSFTTRDGDMAIRSDRGQEGYSLQDLPEF